MDIEFIKWMCEKAEGFSYEIGSGINAVVVGKYAVFSENDIKQNAKRTFTSRLWVPVYYPLLLQRAIEGVNNKNIDIAEGFYIEQMTGQIIVCQHCEPYVLFENKPIDQAKEAALKFISEQEKK